MHMLFNVIYAAHANGTHHKLALDALRHLEGADAAAWRRVFLKHAELYMTGSKAPDTEFKDFKNHVLHVGDDYWGGAPEKVASWYAMLVDALKGRQWSEAVYAAGILSHYYTDPIHPFHTGQSAAENNIHRAVEWSINRSYDALNALGATLDVAPPVPAEGAGWLKDLVCQGAETSHRSYETLIAHYDIHRGVSDPPAGLDQIARRHVAELIVYAQKGYAVVLTRALAEAGVPPPEVALTLETVLATLKVPAKWLLKRMTSTAERAEVQAMYDELVATGRVERTLPEDDRVVRDLHAREVLVRKEAAAAAARARRIAGDTVAASRPGALQRPQVLVQPPALATATGVRRPAGAAAAPVPAAETPEADGDALAAVTPSRIPPNPSRLDPAAPAIVGPPPQTALADRTAPLRDATIAGEDAPPPLPEAATATAVPEASGDLDRAIDGLRTAPPEEPAAVVTAQAAADAAPPAGPDHAAEATASQTAEPAGAGEDADVASAAEPAAPMRVTRPSRARHADVADAVPRFYLSATDDLEAAPSIGPKSAERFAALGIATVGDFLLADPAELAAGLKMRGVDAETLVAWQDQARLVMSVPGLRGTHSQLLVGAGYRSASALAEADAASLSADVLRYAQTSEGQRVLRQGEPPDIARIMSWIALAASAEAA